MEPGWWDAAFARQGHTGWADAQVYAYDQPLRRRAVRRVLARSRPQGLSGCQAIDIGCGTGDFAALLHALGADVLAFDFSVAVLAAARARFPPGTSRVQLRQASATQIPAPDGWATVITCITVLQHLVSADDLRRAITEIRRVLRADGIVVFLELAPPLDRPNVSPDGHVIERPAETWRAAFRQGGLRVTSEAVYPQYGITALRLLANAIDRIRGGEPSPAPAPPPVADVPVTASRRALRLALLSVRAALLAAAWPLDHVFHLAVPPRHRYYRLWILQPSDGEQ